MAHARHKVPRVLKSVINGYKAVLHIYLDVLLYYYYEQAIAHVYALGVCGILRRNDWCPCEVQYSATKNECKPELLHEHNLW